MINQNTENWISILFHGVDFEFYCDNSPDGCISKMESSRGYLRKNKKWKYLEVHPTGANSYEFSFDSIVLQTSINYKGIMAGQSDGSTYVSCHANIPHFHWIGPLWAAAWGLILIRIWPLSIPLFLVAVGMTLSAIRDCRNAPKALFDLLSDDKHHKSKEKPYI